jgi:hypothetical protein
MAAREIREPEQRYYIYICVMPTLISNLIRITVEITPIAPVLMSKTFHEPKISPLLDRI